MPKLVIFMFFSMIIGYKTQGLLPERDCNPGMEFRAENYPCEFNQVCPGQPRAIARCYVPEGYRVLK